MSPTASRSADSRPVLLQSGRTTYELVRPLERTPHGELLLARRRFDVGFGDYVVLKRLSRECREEDYRRLMEEAAIASQLHHPGIAAVQDLEGTVGDPYLVMEHVDGYRLDTLLEFAAVSGKHLSEAFACYVGAEIADALHHAHALTSEDGRPLRVVHRNVSPRTIMVSTRGEAKLIDFGAVWSVLPGRQPTEDDPLPGNIAYVSPELTRKGPLDGRTDLFSLGAVLLRVLTGKALVEGADRVTHEIHELRRRVDEALALGPGDRAAASLAVELRTQIRKRTWECVERIRALTTRDVVEATRMLPAGLRPILQKALAPHRTDRYRTGADFSHYLRLHLWRIGQLYGRHEAEREISALSRAAMRIRTRAVAARAPAPGESASTHRHGASAAGRRASHAGGARRKRDTPT